jgi:hypothetical protein
MDSLLERVRAADPVLPGEFAGRADFAALQLAPPPRRRRRWLSLPAVGAVVAALVLVPSSAPQAKEIVARASAAVGADGILYARSHARLHLTGGGVEDFGEREVWVDGDRGVRRREADGDEEVYAAGAGTTRYDAASGRTEVDEDVRMLPGDLFRATALLRSARTSGDVRLLGEETVAGRPAYVLRWHEPSGPPNHPELEQTLWVDRETYAPLRFTDHASGRDAGGQPLDQTYEETVLDFRTLPDTPANRAQLEPTAR